MWTTVPIAPMQAPVNAPVAKTVGVFERGIKAEATMETTEGGTRELFTMAFDPHGSYLRLFETRGGGGMVQQEKVSKEHKSVERRNPLECFLYVSERAP